MIDIYCPKCKTDFLGDPLEGGECPNCGNEYIWDEMCTEDYSDCWSVTLWESNDWKY